jgi:hypothetical protein
MPAGGSFHPIALPGKPHRYTIAISAPISGIPPSQQ